MRSTRRTPPSVVVLMLAATSTVALAQRSPRVTDATVLPAILKAAAKDAGPAVLQVDSRPLIADPEGLYEIRSAPVTREVLDRRAAIIRAAGFPIVDTTLVNTTTKCPGVLVPTYTDSLGRIVDRRVAGCPEEPVYVLAIGPLRPGNATIPNDRVYDRSVETAACGYWAARVIRLSLLGGRSSGYAADYVLAERDGKWIVVKIVGLMYSE